MFKKVRRFKVLTRPQKSIFSAAMVIMVMAALSRVLGLVRNRILASVFNADELAVYLAAFRLPEIAFEILVFGALSSAIIPVLAEYFSKGKKKAAMEVLSVALTWSVTIFAVFGLILWLSSGWLYKLMLPGFDAVRLAQTVKLARILIWTQVFFAVSYLLTAFLEVKKRFLIPALAPLFYNAGIIGGAVFLTKAWGIYGLAWGAVFGSLAHLLVQLPFCLRLGWQYQPAFKSQEDGFDKVRRLAWPRMVELGVLQVAKSIELYLSSLISGGAYTFLTFAQSLQQVPVSLFGVSLAKASLPTMAYQRNRPQQFRRTFTSSFLQILFLTLPAAVFLVVLRLPLVRLFFGTRRFDWEATLQTSYVLSAFGLGIPFYALTYLLNRAFYALQQTRIPVKISILSISFSTATSFALVRGLGQGVWSIAFASACGSIFQVVLLFLVLNRSYIKVGAKHLLVSAAKMALAALLAGGVMFVLLKGLDAYSQTPLSSLGLVWPVEEQVWEPLSVDTRYAANLTVFSLFVALVGGLVYLGLVWWWRVEELFIITKLLTRFDSFGLLPRWAKKREAYSVEEE